MRSWWSLFFHPHPPCFFCLYISPLHKRERPTLHLAIGHAVYLGAHHRSYTIKEKKGVSLAPLFFPPIFLFLVSLLRDSHELYAFQGPWNKRKLFGINIWEEKKKKVWTCQKTSGVFSAETNGFRAVTLSPLLLCCTSDFEWGSLGRRFNPPPPPLPHKHYPPTYIVPRCLMSFICRHCQDVSLWLPCHDIRPGKHTVSHIRPLWRTYALLHPSLISSTICK
jgi:hypothetical protein